MNEKIIQALSDWLEERDQVVSSKTFNDIVVQACQFYLDTNNTSFNELVKNSANEYSNGSEIGFNYALLRALQLYTGSTSTSLDRLIELAVNSGQGFDLDFTKTHIPFTGTFSRTGAGYAETQGGVLVPFASGVPRITDKGLLVEGQATNLLTQSEFANGVTDAPTRGGLVSATSFSGFAGGIAFGHDGSTTSWAYKTFSTAATTTYTISVFVEMADGLAPSFGASTVASALNDFVLVVGADAIGPLSYVVQPLAGGVYRVSATTTTGASPGTSNGVVKYNTNSSRTFKVTGYQLEAASFASSYIPTTGAQATRGADDATLASLTIPSEATFVWRGELNALTTATRLFELHDGTENNRIFVQVNNSGVVTAFATLAGSTTTIGTSSAGAVTAGTPFRVAVRRNSAGTWRLFVNGTAIGSETAAVNMPAVTTLGLGRRRTGAEYLFGYIDRFVAYPHGLSDTEAGKLN
jgi:hypothetical protein